MNFIAFARKVAEKICPANVDLAVESLMGLYDLANLWATESEHCLKTNYKLGHQQRLLQIQHLFDLEPMHFCVTNLTTTDNLTLRALAKDHVFRRKKLRDIALESKNLTWLFRKQGSNRITIALAHRERSILKTISFVRTRTSLPKYTQELVKNDPVVQALFDKWQVAKTRPKAQNAK